MNIYILRLTPSMPLMKMTTICSLLFLGMSVFPALAEETLADLKSDIATGTGNPRGDWAFLQAENPPDYGQNFVVDTNLYTPIANRDWNPRVGAGREMWYATAGDAFSLPAIRTTDFADETKRDVRVHGGTTNDAIIAWTSPVSGNIRITGSIHDRDPGKGGDFGHLRISQLPAGNSDDVNVLEDITITDNATEPDTFDFFATVQEGDTLYFRKTTHKIDQFGIGSSSLDITITQTP
jgi:hypothetical protein